MWNIQSPVIALLSDFGLRDWFVSAMKGVISGIAPDARVVDLSHTITRHNVSEGAFFLKMCYRNFPEGTTFCTVVDPGVGSEREPIVIKGEGYFFVGPNNGLLSYPADELKKWECRIIQNKRFLLTPLSATFHGRDIFASTAAHLASGKAFDDVGPLVSKSRIVVLRNLKPTRRVKSLYGRVMYIDSFGNLISNIPLPGEHDLRTIRDVLVGKHEKRITAVGRCFSEAEQGEPLVYAGSSHMLEVAVNRGNAAEQLGATVGDPLVVTLK